MREEVPNEEVEEEEEEEEEDAYSRSILFSLPCRSSSSSSSSPSSPSSSPFISWRASVKDETGVVISHSRPCPPCSIPPSFPSCFPPSFPSCFPSCVSAISRSSCGCGQEGGTMGDEIEREGG